MKIIDSHLHFSDIESFKRTAAEISHVDYSSGGLEKEFKDAGVIIGIGMGLTEKSPGGFPDAQASNPMGLDLENRLPGFLYQCPGVNPLKLSEGYGDKELLALREELGKESTAGIKIYAGYYHYFIYDSVYEPVYELAREFKLPVVIHCGDTFSERGLLKYSHPLNIDEIAVTHRDINFIISHMGDPWVMDAAEVAAKNYNVFVDMSGLLVGDAQKINRFKDLRIFTDRFRQGLIFTDNYEKYIFGSDWPLVPVNAYIDFIKALVPERYYENVFFKNALAVFPKLNSAGLSA